MFILDANISMYIQIYIHIYINIYVVFVWRMFWGFVKKVCPISPNKFLSLFATNVAFIYSIFMTSNVFSSRMYIFMLFSSNLINLNSNVAFAMAIIKLNHRFITVCVYHNAYTVKPVYNDHL